MTLWQEIQQIEEELSYYRSRCNTLERTIRELLQENQALKNQLAQKEGE